MATLVGCFGTAHVVMSRNSAGEAGERVFAGMREVGRRIRALHPDIIVIVSSEHFYNYHGLEKAAFAVTTSDRLTPYGDMDLPREPIFSNGAFGREIVAAAATRNFEVRALDDSYQPDHGIMIPALTIGRHSRPPIVGVITNLGLERPPSMQEGWQLGEIIREVIEKRPRGERVVVVGTGGLSHWLGVPEMGRINQAFDERILEAMVSGQARQLVNLTVEDVLREAGNGGLEIVNWSVMAGTVPGARGERIYYEALPQWMTGLGGIELKVEIEARH